MNKNPSRIRKVLVKDLELGMMVTDVGRSWLRHPWPTKKKRITSDQDIDLLIEHGITEVTVDFESSQSELSRAESGASPGKVPPKEFGISDETLIAARQVDVIEVARQASRGRTASPMGEKTPVSKPPVEAVRDVVNLAEELPLARRVYLKALDATRNLLADVRAGRKIKVGEIQDGLDGMIDSVFRNRDAMLALIKLQCYDEYTYTHSLNVTTLAVSVGRQIGLTRSQLRELGLGALFHDLGKTRVPDAILNKPGRLTDDEFEVMKNHPAWGVQILARQEIGITEAALHVIRHHHERLDGSGYPDGLSGETIDAFIALSGLADIYDALSSQRVYKMAMPPHEALKVLFKLRGNHFPPRWVDRFIQCLGIYPVGCVVRLNTGDIGVVISVNHETLHRPRLRMVYDRRSRRVLGRSLVDLTGEDASDRDIVKVLDPSPLGIQPADYLAN